MKILGKTIRAKTLRGVSREVSRIVRRDRRAVKIRKALMMRAETLRERAVGFGHYIAHLTGTLTGTTAYQVRPSADGWMIVERGSNIPVRVFSRKQDAVREAKEMAIQNHATLDIFTKRGEAQ